MMRKILAVLCLGAVMQVDAASVPAATTNALAAKLRTLVRLPQVSFNLEPTFGRNSGITAEEDVADPAGELARVTPTLTGKPTEAAERLRLYRLAMNVGDTNALVHRQEALAGYRAWTNTAGADVAVRLGMAKALWLSGEEVAAEAQLREITDRQPGNWEAWVLLGDVLGTRSLALFTGWGDEAPPNAMGAYVVGRLKPKGDAKAAAALFEEAGRCQEKALQAAPDEPRVWAARLPFFLDREMRRRVLANPPTPGERQAAVSLLNQAAAAPEVEAALKKLPDDYRLQGLAIYVRILPELAEARVRLGINPDGRRAIDSLRSDTRTWVHERMDRLEALVTNSVPGITSDPRRRAGAAELAASYQYVLMGNGPAAVRLARRALELDPSRRRAFELVIAGVVNERRWSDLETMCTQRIQSHDSPLSRLLLAKALYNGDRREASFAALSEAVQKFPQDRLLQAAWLAARVAVPGAPEDPRMSARLHQMFPDPANTPDDTDANRSVVLSAIIAQAMEGELAMPKKVLRSLLGADPDDDYARSVLLALP